MADLSIELLADFIPKDGVCLPCILCEDAIFGTRYNLEIMIAGKGEETEINFCSPCYNLLEYENR